LGSPIFGDAGAWGPRISKGKDTLYTHAINGFNAMPAKGGADIPDEEVQNAVDYMVEAAS
ncbi:MAG: c-type cytochrome, partial [Psychrobacter alimentarius]